MLEAVTYLASCLGALLLALLFLPVVVAVSVSRTDHPSALAIRLDGTVLAGLVGISVRQTGATRRLYPLVRRWTIGGGRAVGKPSADDGEVAAAERAVGPEVSSPPDAAFEAEEGAAGAIAASSIRSSIDQALSLVRRVREMSGLLARPGLQLLVSLRRAARLRRLSVRGYLGLGDPAATGSACALLHGVRPVKPRRVSIDITPDFVTPRVEGQADVVVHLYLGQALACVLRFGVRVGLGWLVLRLRKMPVLARAAALARATGRRAR